MSIAQDVLAKFTRTKDLRRPDAAYHKLYFGFDDPKNGPLGDVLPTLIQTAESVRRDAVSPPLVS